MRLLKAVALVSCVLILATAGCGGRRPLQVESPVVTPKGIPSDEEVFKAILRAAAITNWSISRAGPGQLVGERVLGNHSATVKISYSPQRYSIALAETTMVDRQTSIGGGAGMVSGQRPGGAAPEETPTTVHRTYNRWVQELDKQIRAQLVTLGL